MSEITDDQKVNVLVESEAFEDICYLMSKDT